MAKLKWKTIADHVIAVDGRGVRWTIKRSRKFHSHGPFTRICKLMRNGASPAITGSGFFGSVRAAKAEAQRLSDGEQENGQV